MKRSFTKYMKVFQKNAGNRSWVIIFTIILSILFSPQLISQDHNHDHEHEHVHDSDRQWLAGDHHIHSRYSVGWDYETDPPSPIIAGDAIYPTPMNALMARYYGLSWMVTTDHGGPNHSKVNLEQAYPELLTSRKAVPEVIQFYGMEFDTPGADHSSLIIPHTHDEADRLYEIESNFNKREPYPADSTWDTEPRMIEALQAMDQFPSKPVVIANHPSRSAPALGVYGLYDPAELRDWNDTTPDIAVGMAGAPGHQAAALNSDGSLIQYPRGGYGNFPTMGGFDQMTARLGGFWDSMLGEGRHWWITANSDSHVHWREGGSDFWPGEYSKTYVWADKSHDDIINGIRNGRVFVTLGDLISELYVTANSVTDEASIGGTIAVEPGSDVQITIRFLDPDAMNAADRNPSVERVDLIIGRVTGPVTDRTADTNPTTEVEARFYEDDWETDRMYKEITYLLEDLDTNSYIRIRGTNGEELEPEIDPAGEDPWADLWFYSNPIFIEVE
ncbi:hypothetical protein [Rhodohalobacter sulfatireducens]|uniref:Phosphoesterase n=1 Tax=Rhodohalobacter sulfatireducens TaxID=2911366 RepID=A0ABS9KG31_9BACT|nr:hypothetical protein [Rhodohalobacter sulfatireducens]MCG2589817.1 hypothetical protein [Rhodohalobacter sulfatireducens]